MTHRNAWALLDEFLDGALASEARWAVAAHLDECALCRQYVATQACLRGFVRERLTAVTPPPDLSARLASALATEAAVPTAAAQRPWPPRPLRLLALLAPALAAVWLLASLVTPAPQSGADLARELAATHTLFARDESLLDIVGDAAVVATWFRDEAGLQVSTPEIGPYTLVGGRLIALEGEAVAQLVYEGKSAEVYLSLLHFAQNGTDRGQIEAPDGLTFDQEGTTSLVSWTAGRDRVALIGAVPGDELRRLAGDLIRQSDGDGSPSG